METIEHPDRQGMNVRQTMLKFKEAHGSGIDLDFPSAEQIQEAMTGFGDDHKVLIYGDRGFTIPKRWWSGLDGFGIWIPEWNQEDEGDGRQQQQQQK